MGYTLWVGGKKKKKEKRWVSTATVAVLGEKWRLWLIVCTLIKIAPYSHVPKGTTPQTQSYKAQNLEVGNIGIPAAAAGKDQ